MTRLQMANGAENYATLLPLALAAAATVEAAVAAVAAAATRRIKGSKVVSLEQLGTGFGDNMS